MIADPLGVYSFAVGCALATAAHFKKVRSKRRKLRANEGDNDTEKKNQLRRSD